MILTHDATPHAAVLPAPSIISRPAARIYEARLVTGDAEKQAVYALRYRSYLSQGHIAPNDSGLLHDRFDEMPTTRTVLVTANGNPVGSIRTCFLRRGPGPSSPCRENYRDEVESLLASCGPARAGFDGVEFNRMVRAPEAADDQGLVFMLLRLAGHLALAEDFRVIVTCVRSHHVPFYKRLRLSEAGDAKIYPGLTCPMVMLQIDRANYDAMRQGFRLMDPEAGTPGLLDGLEDGATVTPALIRRS